jgi:hypothetical protein
MHADARELAAKRIHWAAVALGSASDVLHGIDDEQAVDVNEAAERVAALSEHVLRPQRTTSL